MSLQYDQLDCIVVCDDCAPADPASVLDIDAQMWQEQFDAVLKR